jgi:hypothetical protein
VSGKINIYTYSKHPNKKARESINYFVLTHTAIGTEVQLTNLEITEKEK